MRSKIWERDLIDEELDKLVLELRDIAKASYSRGMSIISLICNVKRTSEILERVRCSIILCFGALGGG